MTSNHTSGFYRCKARLFCLCIALLTVSAIPVSAQNLVPNGDFEQYNSCPTTFTSTSGGTTGIAYSPGYTDFPTVKDWVRPVYNNTPDYYNACASGNMGIPANATGYQTAHSGNGYAGIYTYYNGPGIYNYREMLTTKLTSPMKKDSLYCVRFFVSPTSSRATSPITINYIGSNEIGAYFSDTLPNVRLHLFQ